MIFDLSGFVKCQLNLPSVENPLYSVFYAINIVLCYNETNAAYFFFNLSNKRIPPTLLQDKTSKRIEITCGEAPYIVSRYDASTGEPIEIKNRIGVLDRKLRVVSENTTTEEEWLLWAKKAFQNVYGYEFQGDNLLIARINLLLTFTEYYSDRWKKNPKESDTAEIAEIIAWNFWQMDGITGTIPFAKPKEKQPSLFDFVTDEGSEEDFDVECKVRDWKNEITISYTKIRDGSWK